MFYSLFAKHARTQPGKIAIVNEGRSITYAELDSLIERTAKNLSAIGVGPQTLVAACFDNNIEYIALYYAIARLGAQIAPLTSTLTADEVYGYCRECRPQFYLVQERYLALYTDVLERVGAGTLISETTSGTNFSDIFVSDSHDKAALPTDRWDDQDFVIQYTSGTTGRPKGIVQKQRGHTHRMLTWAQTGELSADDNTLCMLSLTHAYGADIITFPALSTGQTLHLLELDQVSPARVLRTLDEEKITIFGSLPWFYREALDLPEDFTADLSSLRISMVGATPLSRQTAENFERRYGVRVNNSYGLTETCLITSNLYRTSKDPLTIGPVIDGVEAEVRDCGLGIPGAGELVVRSAAFADRYYSPEVGPLWKDGYIHTGDLVRRDDGGNFYVLARVAEVIEVDDDKKVLPFEVEELLEKIPAVKDVAVVPVDDGSGRPKVGAFIVPRAPLEEVEVRAFVEANLAPHKVPAYFRFWESFPKSVTGKISKAKLTLDAPARA